MPNLFKNITGEILDNFTSNVKLTKALNGEFGQEDYVELGGLIAYLQDFRKIPNTTDLVVPPTFGLKTKTEYVTIEISY